MCLRILHVVGTMNRGGAETLLMNLYRRIDREKIQFDFVTHNASLGAYDEEIKSLGGQIFHFSRYKGINHFQYVKEWHVFFRNHPEYNIIHGHMRSTASIYLAIAKKYSRITIAHSHSTSSRGNIIHKLVKLFIQYPIRFIADYYFACSLTAGIWLFGKKICYSTKFHILNNAIESNQFVFDENIRNRIREELSIEEKFVIGHVGNFDPVKNHVFLLDVFARLCQTDDDCVLLLVGGGNMKIRLNIENMAHQLGLSSKIFFLGERSDINEVLNAFDLFLFPSFHEGLGIAAVEAQANGLQCILSDMVPEEVDVSGNVEFISLKRPAEFWAERIFALKKNDQRQDMRNVIRNAGYDINSAAQWLTNFYLILQNEKRKI